MKNSQVCRGVLKAGLQPSDRVEREGVDEGKCLCAGASEGGQSLRRLPPWDPGHERLQGEHSVEL